MVCTFAENTPAAPGSQQVVLGGPGEDPARGYTCTSEMKSRPDSAATLGEIRPPSTAHLRRRVRLDVRRLSGASLGYGGSPGRGGTDPAAGRVLGGVQQRQGQGGSAVIRFRVVGCVLLLAHLLLVAWVTLRPRDVMWVTATNLTPLAGIKADLALGPLEAAHQIGEGLLLLAPLGVLLPMAGGRLRVSPFASLVRTVAGRRADLARHRPAADGRARARSPMWTRCS